MSVSVLELCIWNHDHLILELGRLGELHSRVAGLKARWGVSGLVFFLGRDNSAS